MIKIDLSGIWKLWWCDIGAGSIAEAKINAKSNCKVPGNVHEALMDEGIIEDPLVDKNSEKCKWVEDKEFWYVKEFNISEEEIKKYGKLQFEGLDLTADVWLNDTFLGRCQNAFIEHKFDVSSYIKEGKNQLVVRIDQGLEAVKNKELGEMQLMWNNDEPYRVWMRKPQYVYSWDWTIWLPTIGIWKPVILYLYDNAMLQEAYVYSEIGHGTIDGNGNATIFADLNIEANENSSGIVGKISVFEDSRFDNGKLVGLTTVSLDHKKALGEIIIENPKFWWCNQYGNPYLYKVVIDIYNNEGFLIDSKTVNHGIRTVTIRENPREEGNKEFTFVINGEPVFCKGANHVPSDCLLGRITEHKDRNIVKLAAECNMNMLRVWGGGIYSSDAFMEACDEYGIMIWHDFMYACGFYPDHDEEFVENITDEAIKAVKRLRNHPSLIGWSGNNEIHSMYESMKNRLHHFYGEKIYHKILPGIVDKYSKNTIYRPCSPYGDINDTNSLWEGDQHTWAFTHDDSYKYKYDLWRFTDEPYTFLSEFGIIGAMNFETAEKCISKENLYLDSKEWLHHSNNYIKFQVLNKIFERYWGDRNKYTLQEYILRSQVIQAEITRHIYDEFRIRKYQCSGLLFWTLGDSFGINNWSIIDYYLGKRPVYDYLRRAMEPLSVAIRGYDVQNSNGEVNYKEYFSNNPKPMEIWITNDTLKDSISVVKSEIIDVNGNVLYTNSEKVIANKNSSTLAYNINIEGIIQEPDTTLLHVQLYDKEGNLIHENKYIFAPFRNLKLNTPKITKELIKVENGVYSYKLKADTFVWLCHLKEQHGIQYSDNNFDLWPGIEKVVEIRSDKVIESAEMMYIN